MKRLALILFSLLLVSACDREPGNTAKKPSGKRETLVKTVRIEPRETQRQIERTGTLKALREVSIATQQEGILVALPHHEGDQVKQGELLLQLDDTLLRAQLRKSEAQRLQAEQDLKRLKRLQGSRVIAEEEISHATNALEVALAEEEELQIRLQQTRISAPFDGTISQRLAEPGDTLSRFQHTLSLLDTSKLTTELQLSEMALAALKPGDQVQLTIDALGNGIQNGTIERIHPVIDAQSRQGTLEIRLDTIPPGAMPGQFCRVTLLLNKSRHLLVPYKALRRDNRGEYLFTVDSDNTVQRRAVISGQHFDEQVAILEGLEESDIVVTQGFQGLAEGRRVKQASDHNTP